MKTLKYPAFYGVFPCFGYIMGFFIFLCTTYSCNDEVLNITPSDRYSDIEVWQDGGLIEAFVNNTYAKIPHGFYYPYRNNLSCYADEIYYRGGGTDFINAGDITPDRLYNLDRWNGPKNYWDVVTNANIFFYNIENSEIDGELKSRMKGEMKMLRGYAYFMLTQFWGGVPLFTEPFELDSDFKIPRKSYEECLAFALNEVEEAIALLPLNYNDDNLGRVTKGAAMGLKSRMTLYAASPLVNSGSDLSKWQVAADAAKAVIDLNEYALFDDYKTLFLRENSYNTEVLWARPFNHPVVSEAAYMELALYPNGYGGYGQPHPIQAIIDDYEMTSGLLPAEDPSYDPQDPYVNRDPRFYASIFYDGAPFQGRTVETFLPGGLDSRESPISPWNATETGYYIRKFCDDKIVNPNTTNQGNSPYIFIRYAEILLNYAEAMYELGDEEAARKYVNMIRSRPGVSMPPIAESGIELRDRIRHERRIELAFEEHRYFDVRRWMIAPEVLNVDAARMDIQRDPSTGKKTYTIVPFNTRRFNDKNYWLPIPQSEIEKNENLTQNQGY
ncbi:RagB/SusD family nutrient uptake outer membrane protein [Membranihabitans maritimus]|uniref:RagB/SusD family nutrient uptake outer membrane protein n=1 Tax=Membranihabitans maritimus TaxID=2904244 RepID=UPI001F386B88|nr:RagB/SusD family nutrient uptake outer membrane protein [Membranihabitans maritimus]